MTKPSLFTLIIIWLIESSCQFKNEAEVKKNSFINHQLKNDSLKVDLVDKSNNGPLKIRYQTFNLTSNNVKKVILKYHYKDLSEEKNTNRIFENKKLDIFYYVQNSSKNLSIGSDSVQISKAVEIYTSNEQDSLLLEAVISIIKYYDQYYLVAFPNANEWMDFFPPTNNEGYFLYNPIAFSLDSSNGKLNKLIYNQSLKIPKEINKSKLRLFFNNKYGLQFDTYFTFSKQKNEFVFGTRK